MTNLLSPLGDAGRSLMGALRRRSLQRTEPASAVDNAHIQQTLEEHKRTGVLVAFRARLIALGVIVLMLPFLYFEWAVLYWIASALLFVAIGWAQVRFARVGRNRIEVLLLAADLALVTFLVTVPNPFIEDDVPRQMVYLFGGHIFLFIYLALGTLSYSWRTIRAFGFFAAVFWGAGALLVWLVAGDHPAALLIQEALVDYPRVAETMDLTSVRFDMRMQEIIIYAVVAYILSLSVRRYGELLTNHASIARERTNLARYFSPNIVEQLSTNDEPLKQVRHQDVAVLFVDIVGFTKLSHERDAQALIDLLRKFHKRMSEAVFDNHGTLDKFLGDGLMATFGTPVARDEDALNALRCAIEMQGAVAEWNVERERDGDPPIQIGVGLHYGPCVLGDVGDENRMEFAIIGETVNIASRVEKITREFTPHIMMTEAMFDEVSRICGGQDKLPARIEDLGKQQIRGIAEDIRLLGVA